MYRKIIFILFLILLFFTKYSYTQSIDVPNVFIDCPSCNMNYIKENIPIVNYVFDRKEADVYVLFTSQRNASGGVAYTLFFIGQNNFENLSDTLKFSTNQNDTEDLSRKKIVKALKSGLLEYIAKLNLFDEIHISFTKLKKEIHNKDKWNFWLFRTGLNGSFNGQANSKALYLNGSLLADRTTKDSKINFSLNSSYNENKYIYDSGSDKTIILNHSRAQGFNAYYIKSIDSNWSCGIWGGINTSTYSNIDFSAYLVHGFINSSTLE